MGVILLGIGDMTVDTDSLAFEELEVREMNESAGMDDIGVTLASFVETSVEAAVVLSVRLEFIEEEDDVVVTSGRATVAVVNDVVVGSVGVESLIIFFDLVDEVV